MGYKKEDWQYFGSKNYLKITFEIVIRDEIGNKLEIKRGTIDELESIIKYLKQKYG